MFCGGRNDHFQDAVSIAQDIGIPEAEDPVAFRFKPPITLDVAFILRVLPAIDLDDQMPIVTNKINNEASDRCLPAKAKTIQPVPAQR